jgi:uncharacterized protein (DUF983 family)
MRDHRVPSRPAPIDSQPTRADVRHRLRVFAVLGALVVAAHVIVGYPRSGSPWTEAFVVAGMTVVIGLALRKAYRGAHWRE